MAEFTASPSDMPTVALLDSLPPVSHETSELTPKWEIVARRGGWVYYQQNPSWGWQLTADDTGLGYCLMRVPEVEVHDAYNHIISSSLSGDNYYGNVWVAVANYGTGRWDYRQCDEWGISAWPALGRPLDGITGLHSPAGFVYVLVVVWQAESYANIGGKWTVAQ